jgi:transposase InsO family protein
LYVLVIIEHHSRRLSADLDDSIQRLGVRVLKSPPQSPKANSICERFIGTLRRECLDWLIPLSESHLRQMLKTRDPNNP